MTIANSCKTVFHFVFLLAIAPGAWAVNCRDLGKKSLDKTYVEEVNRQWDYLDVLKRQNERAIKKKSKRLIKALWDHAFQNGLILEGDPSDSHSLLISREGTHPLNRFAKSVNRIFDGLRVEINPLKLKLDDAGALFDESTQRLTLARDNAVLLKNDSFTGHEIRHAFNARLEKLGIEHDFMGWVKRKPGAPPFHETYPEAYSQDELAAYHYQALVLLREAKTDPQALSTAKAFLETGLVLTKPLASGDFSVVAKSQLENENSAHSRSEDRYNIVTIETSKAIYELNFLDSIPRTPNELKGAAQLRLSQLAARAKNIEQQFQNALEKINDHQTEQAIEILARGRNVIDPKVLFTKESGLGSDKTPNPDPFF